MAGTVLYGERAFSVKTAAAAAAATASGQGQWVWTITNLDEWLTDTKRCVQLRWTDEHGGKSVSEPLTPFHSAHYISMELQIWIVGAWGHTHNRSSVLCPRTFDPPSPIWWLVGLHHGHDMTMISMISMVINGTVLLKIITMAAIGSQFTLEIWAYNKILYVQDVTMLRLGYSWSSVGAGTGGQLCFVCVDISLSLWFE